MVFIWCPQNPVGEVVLPLLSAKGLTLKSNIQSGCPVAIGARPCVRIVALSCENFRAVPILRESHDTCPIAPDLSQLPVGFGGPEAIDIETMPAAMGIKNLRMTQSYNGFEVSA